MQTAFDQVKVLMAMDILSAYPNHVMGKVLTTSYFACQNYI